MRGRQISAFSPPFFFRFFPLIICFFCWALTGFISVGKVFGKAFRILGLDERKGKQTRWVVEQDIYGNFQVNVAWFLAFSPAYLTRTCSFWYGLKDLFTLHELAHKVVLEP